MIEPRREKFSSDSVAAVHSGRLATLRLLSAAGWTLLLAPLQAILLGVGAVSWSRRNARRYWRGVAAIMGLKLIVRGALSDRQPVLFVSNHISWLDIVALGAVLDAAFVAKAEVKGWPVFGWIAQLGRTVYVDRQRRTSGKQRDGMIDRLTKAQESLILFPEGTSHDGNLIRAFKSALLSAAAVPDAAGRPMAVQPVTIAYTRLDGMPIGRAWRPLYGWFGDMALAPHLWTMIGLGTTTVEIELHPVTSLDQFPSRKELAEYCHGQIARGLAAANSGRLAPPLDPRAKPI